MSVSYYTKTTVTTTTTTSAGTTTTHKTTTSSGDPNAAKLAAKFDQQLQQFLAKAQPQVTPPPPPPPPPAVDVPHVDVAADKTPADSAPADEPADKPVDKAPAEAAPADNGPADKAPAEQAQADAGSSDEQVILGNGKDNVLEAPESGGTVRGLGGNDTITDGKGDDTISGGKGDDTVVLKNGGTNHAQTGSGNDFVDAHAGKNTIETFSGTDTVVLSGGENTLNTGDDADSVALLGGKNEIDTGDGNDHVEIDGGHNTVWLGKGDDTVIVRGGNNTIFGEQGKDTVVLTGRRDDYTEISDPDGQAFRNNATGEVTRVFQADVVFGAERDVVVEPETIPIGGSGNGDVTATPGKPGTDGGSTKPDGVTTLKARDATDGGVFHGTEKADDVDIESGYRSAVNGGDGNDFFHVNGGETGVLDGGAGDDVFQLSGGFVDLVKGGEGEDVAMLGGTKADYKEPFLNEDGSTRFERVDGTGTFSIARDVETIEFSDGTIAQRAPTNVEGQPVVPDDLPTIDTGNSGGGTQQSPLIERRGTDSGFVQPVVGTNNLRAENAGGGTFIGDDQDNSITLVSGTGTVIGRGGEDTVILDGQASDYRTEEVRITDGDGTQEATRYIRNDGTADFIIADDVENVLFQDVAPTTTPPGVSVTPVNNPDGDGGNGGVDGGNGNGNGGGTTSGGVTTNTTPSNIPAGVTGDGSVGNPFTVTTLSEDFRAPRDVENNIIINGDLGNVVFGGDLSDTFTVNGGSFGTINGGRGDDQFIINGGSGFILGSAGTDTFIINNLDGRINLSGTAGDRVVFSGSAADWVAIPTNGNGTTYTRSSNAIQNEDGTFRAIDRNQVVVIPNDFVIEFSAG